MERRLQNINNVFARKEDSQFWSSEDPPNEGRAASFNRPGRRAKIVTPE
jgi:hypothetical protein